MNDFKEALGLGLQAADRATMARAEIEAIFLELNAALEAATAGRASIRRTNLPSIASPTARALANVEHGRPTALAVFGGGDPPPRREIAKWRQPTGGFPCTLVWEERNVQCDDAEALRAELIDLLRSPTVGYAIKSIVGVD
ncbi:MAG: hypothetical protein J7598_24665 [Mitsuaria chitosanitabida]|uniref:hypothetical protein n=1 Tax=Roseateles chitosanitabidus TaxID=65048 RepID=UPI001B2608AE|nr:hypothetical protein [Roseateles chitosanitabidus]MBO9689807.1 hypothetical protein [Roseateles chitosanitabidus]